MVLQKIISINRKATIDFSRLFFLMIIIVVVSIALILVGILNVCTFILPSFLEKTICGGMLNLDIKRYYENFQEIPFKLDYAIYTFLSTNTSVSVERCIKYIDCLQDTSQEMCQNIYGELDEDTCRNLIVKTLSAVWENKISLTIISTSGASVQFVGNSDEFDTINPVYTVERKLHINYPGRDITLKFEVW